MARPKADPSDLLKRIDAAMQIAKRSDVLDAEGMAACLGMTWRNLKVTHLDPDPAFPVKKRGAEGIAWEFHVLTVLRHMRKRARERIEKAATQAKRLQQLTNFTVPDEETDALTLVELSKLAELTTKVQAAKERQGGYVPSDKLRLFLGRYHSKIRDALLGAPAKVDPTGSLPPETRALLDNEVRSLIVQAEAAVETFLRNWDEGIQQAGTR